MFERPGIWLLACAIAASPLTGKAEVLTCIASQAWRLEAGGLAAHPQGPTGYQEAALLSVDTAKLTLSTTAGPLKDVVLRSSFDPATGADLVFSTPDASLLFRARRFEDGISYMLMDTYDLYVGTCRE